MDLPEEFEAPRLVEPRPLDPRPRFGDWPRAARELPPRSIVVVVVAIHEEEVGRRAEENFKGIGGLLRIELDPIVRLFVWYPSGINCDAFSLS